MDPPSARHVDVSLWFALSGHAGEAPRPDEREFRQVRWWTATELRQVDLGRFESQLLRALDVPGLGR